MPLPPGKSALWVAMEYTNWLPRFFKTVFVAEVDPQRNLCLRLRFPRISLLKLAYVPDRSKTSNRQVFFVVGGWLARLPKKPQETRKPRLEFREALGGSCLLADIHDYRPTLPWPIYNYTQALTHAWVMRKFGQHLERIR
jgi:hypothetical protein